MYHFITASPFHCFKKGSLDSVLSLKLLMYLNQEKLHCRYRIVLNKYSQLNKRNTSTKATLFSVSFLMQLFFNSVVQDSRKFTFILRQYRVVGIANTEEISVANDIECDADKLQDRRKDGTTPLPSEIVSDSSFNQLANARAEIISKLSLQQMSKKE